MPPTTLRMRIDLATREGDEDALEALRAEVLSAFERAGGNLGDVASAFGCAAMTIRRATELLQIRDVVNERWPERRGERASPGRPPAKRPARRGT
jgi:hypothetical protein